MKKFLCNVLSLVLLLSCFLGVPFIKAKAISYAAKDIDTVVTDSLKTEEAENWYKMKTTKDGYFTLKFDPFCENEYGWNIGIYDQNHNQIKDYSSVKGTFISERIMFPKGTIFYIKIEPWIPSERYCPIDVDYDIVVKQVSSSNWEKEENGTTTKANKLKSGKAMYGTLWKKDDVDYFSFKTTKNGYTRFKFAVEEEGDIKNGWNIYFKDGNGNELYSVNGIETDYISRRFNFKKGTTIYVEVAPQTSFWSPVDIKYSIKPIETEKSTWEIERNDRESKATIITSGKLGTIYNVNDVDYYKYKAPATKTKKVKFTIEDDVAISNGWNVTIYKTSIDRNNIVASQNSITRDTTFKFKAKKGVIYYIVIKAYISYGGADIQDVLYKLKIS